MKWVFSLIATVSLALCLPGLAQSNTGTSNSTNNSNQSGSSMGQSNSSQSGSSSQNSAKQNDQYGQVKHTSSEKDMEGCIVRENTYYYLVPENGERVRLNSDNSDVSKNEGHHVRIEGRESNGTQGNENQNMSGSSSGSQNMNKSGNSGGEKEVVVDKLQTISATCPANGASGTNQQR